ncbi:MAG TPA: hypothetical protein VIK56_16685 [Rhodoferax sp.]
MFEVQLWVVMVLILLMPCMPSRQGFQRMGDPVLYRRRHKAIQDRALYGQPEFEVLVIG